MKTETELANRVREIRQDLYGEEGLKYLARALGVPTQTWRNYERGVKMPARVLLEFIDLTGANPRWLLTGEGERLSEEIFLFPTDTVPRSDVVENR
jgi:hypothetical protein